MLEASEEDVKYACDDFGVMSCELGASLIHAGHTLKPIEEASLRERSKVLQVSKDVERATVLYQSELDEITQNSIKCHENVVKLHEKVDRDLMLLTDALRERAAAAHANIEQLEEEAQRRVDEKTNLLQDRLSRAHSYLGAVQLVPHGASAEMEYKRWQASTVFFFLLHV